MAIAHYKAVTSMEAIKDSIRIDRYVFRWFSYLIVQPDIKDKIKNSPEAQKSYEQLMRLTMIHAAVHFTLLIALYFLILKFSWEWVAFIIVINVISLKISKVKKEAVASLSEQVLLNDYPLDELSKMTLYEFSEIYSKKYNIPSLVDTIYIIDRALRRAVLWTFVLTCFIYPLNYWEALFVVLVTFFMVRLIVNLAFFYKRLR